MNKIKNKKPKVIAFYLPQFHRIPENDEWWGEGFTEWVSVKNADRLFPGHKQPRVPMNNNYYNLLDKSTMQWQAKLARNAGIYGFCIYHYWFGEKQLLEKPAENLLKWKDININFCFSWANQTWVASWSKLAGVTWQNTLLTKDEKGRGILVEQTYGNKIEWKRHYDYLLPFFKDKRYIKKDGKPVFIIYTSDKFRCLQEMINYWNELAIETGFNGIYFIGTNENKRKYKGLDAMLRYEPAYTFENRKNDNKYSLKEEIDVLFKNWLKKHNIDFPKFVDYGDIWEEILTRQIEKNVYSGGFVDYDDSPRRGKQSVIVRGGNAIKFYKYFSKLYSKCYENNDEFIFITAWNEWGEGAYLEPDKSQGFAYLNAIKRSINKIK
jgi:hypothetical protein